MTMRVLHAPLNVGGHVHNLYLAERALGLDSELLLTRLDTRAPDVAGTIDGRELDARLPSPGAWRRRRRFLDWAMDRFDVFHFNFGRSLLDFPYFVGLEHRDLALLRGAGKRIVFTFQGCDARDKWDHLGQPGWSACPTCEVPWCRTKSLLRRRRLALVREHADHVFVLNPDLRRRLPASEFLPYAIADPVPGGVRERPAGQRDEVVVVHAPTDRAIKGTAHLERAVAALQAAGVPIRLEVLEGLTRAQVLERVAAADIAVDQLLIGWYGSFAVESLWRGVPTVCFLDFREAAGCVPAEMLEELPILNASPDDIKTVLAALAHNAGRRRALGERGRAFARRWHHPEAVAARVMARYGD